MLKENTIETKEIDAKVEEAPVVESEKKRKPKVLSSADIIEKQRAIDERKVKGTFIYRSKPGGRYRTATRKYKKSGPDTDQQGFYHIDMTDGQEYTVPYWIAEWLNGEAELSCSDIKYKDGNIEIGKETRPVPEKIPVFRFVIKEYV